MFAKFFIERPIFAWVISIVILLLGGVAVFTLPVAQYPNITPPSVQVTASYPGANCQVVADSVAAPIEQQVNGVERMIYMSSPVHQRRLVHADRHVRAGHRSEHGPGAGAKPRGAGDGAVAGAGASAGREHQQAIAQHFAGGQFVFRPTAGTTTCI